ncbi:hypothetical protein DL767_009804 [Monosporascus sp. MG133]|nr:hypothetical protein DL767_009804 [Monosporascus sp. MG133]
MSIRIVLDNAPEFYTNLDFVSGRVFLDLTRPENVGNIIVKLEGESLTALAVPLGDRRKAIATPRGNVVTENHKLLYKVQQVYPDERTATALANPGFGSTSTMLNPGHHEFRFQFKVPLNNICYDPQAMSALVGIGGVPGVMGGGVGGPGGGGGAPGPGFLGFGGFRTMDGSRQLFLHHVKATLPPSLTGFPQEAEIRYYIKVTIQRPGFFKENWRYQVGFKFLPIEPPRPPPTNQEAFARRPFTFKLRTPLTSASSQPYHQRKSFFGLGGSSSGKTNINSNKDEAEQTPQTPPSVEMSARLPYPSIVTCNEPLPLRILARKLAPATETVHLVGVEIALVGYTHVRVQDLHNEEVTRWIVFSSGGASKNLSIELGTPQDPVDAEFEVPGRGLWADRPLPNTIAPSFRACNLSRRYEIEVNLSLSWGGVPVPQVIHLPLKLSKIEVFSGIRPPPQLLESLPPQVPPRPSTVSPSPSFPSPFPHQAHPHPQPYAQPPQQDPLYPPQLGPGNAPAPYDAPPPSYDEAMAADLTAPPPQARPAYSGVTAENAPSTMPAAAGGGGEKS